MQTMSRANREIRIPPVVSQDCKFTHLSWEEMRKKAYEFGLLPIPPVVYGPTGNRLLFQVNYLAEANDRKGLMNLGIRDKEIAHYRDICIIALVAKQRLTTFDVETLQST